MKRQHREGSLWLVALALLTAVGIPASIAIAQTPAKAILTDPRLVVIPSRNLDYVSSDLAYAQESKQMAQERRTQAEVRLREIDGAIESRQAAEKDIKRRMDDAKKAKRETEAVALKIEAQVSKQAVDLLKKLKELRKAELEAAEIEIEAADLSARLYQTESELLRKRAEYDSFASAGVEPLTLTAAGQVIRELEVNYLKVDEQRAGLAQKLAAKERDIASRRLKLHEAQLKLGSPRA